MRAPTSPSGPRPARLCITRYGAISKARPPATAASSDNSNSRSHSVASTPAAKRQSNVNRFQASTEPSRRSSGQYGSAKGHQAAFTVDPASGWNE
jgi:hypothetical protein